ncbi:MAG: hypothetical protein GEV06_26860 [Luteitalea sp.]|nr:hypothetical protein [Luteitalea sp.]
MQLLSDDDLNLKEMTDEELEAAWDLWFDLAQTTNEADPPYTHGVLMGLGHMPHSQGDPKQEEPPDASPS